MDSSWEAMRRAVNFPILPLLPALTSWQVSKGQRLQLALFNTNALDTLDTVRAYFVLAKSSARAFIWLGESVVLPFWIMIR